MSKNKKKLRYDRESKNNSKYNKKFLLWEKQLPELEAAEDVTEVLWAVDGHVEASFTRTSILKAISEHKAKYCPYGNTYFLCFDYSDLVKVKRISEFEMALDNYVEENPMIWYESDFKAGAKWAKKYIAESLSNK